MIDLQIILFFAFSLYVLVMVVFLLLDNKESGSTIAWIFVFILLPGVGLILYLLVGRDWRKYSKKKKLSEQLVEENLVKVLNPLINVEDAEIKKIEEDAEYNYKKELLHLLRRNSNSLLTGKNKVQILQDGKEKFPALMKDIENAKDFIHMEYFIWRSDDLTKKIRDLLIRKAQEGVEVRILFDALGGFLLNGSYIRKLRKGGVKIYPYLGFLSPLKFHTINYRNHRKIAVIDGQIGYTGGMNIGKEYLDGGKKFKVWRDTHIRIEGQAVAILQGIFTTSWFNTTKEKLFDKKYFPSVENSNGEVPIQITTSGPDSEWGSIHQLYFELIKCAKKSISIQTPYFIPDPSIYMALKTSALAGMDVKIMITGVSDKYLPYWAAYTYFEDLLRAGVKIYHYNRGLLHSKIVSIDGEVCSVGTANMDVRSFHLNYELNTLVYDEKVARELQQDFLEDLKYCKEFTLKDYANLGFWKKLRNSMARVVAPLL